MSSACGREPPTASSAGGTRSAAEPAAYASLVEVSVRDEGFSPQTADVKRGGSVRWSFEGPARHTATDATGMGLFDSGVRAPGGRFEFTFIAAGVYR